MPPGSRRRSLAFFDAFANREKWWISKKDSRPWPVLCTSLYIFAPLWKTCEFMMCLDRAKCDPTLSSLVSYRTWLYTSWSNCSKTCFTLYVLRDIRSKFEKQNLKFTAMFSSISVVIAFFGVFCVLRGQGVTALASLKTSLAEAKTKNEERQLCQNRSYQNRKMMLFWCFLSKWNCVLKT